MIVIGDTPQWTISLLNMDGDPLDLSGHTVTVTFKANVNDADDEAVFQHYIIVAPDGSVTDSNGMQLGPGGVGAGVIIETMTAEESDAITVRKAKGDLEVRYDDQVHTPLHAIEETFVAGYTNAAP